MRKLKKLMLLFLTLGMTAAFVVGCGKSDNSTPSNSSPEQQSSSLEISSEEISSEISSEEISSEISSEEISSEVSSEEISSEVSSEEISSEESSEEISSEISSEEISSEEGSEEESSEIVEHVCITDGDWVSNKSGHWLVCTCGQLVGYGSHSGEAEICGEKPTCTTCGASYGKEKEHTYGALSDGEFGMAYYCDCGAYLTNENLVDFIVEVESGKDPVVLQLSDTQTCNWGNLDTMCNNYIRETVAATDPDLIILTGDIVYGKFDPQGALLKNLIACMESLNVPWAPVFGNHDNESLMGVDWQCAQLEAAENCLFKQGDLTGNGNYSVGIEQDGKLLRVFYMMDSNGCSSPMTDEAGNAIIPDPGTNEVRESAGFASDQVIWFTDQIEAIHALDADVKISFAYHIQQIIFQKAFEKYDEYDGTLVDGSNSELKNPLNLDTLETKEDTDFCYIGRTTKGPWDIGNAVFKKMKELGTDSIFVGHEHCNSASIVYLRRTTDITV